MAENEQATPPPASAAEKAFTDETARFATPTETQRMWGAELAAEEAAAAAATGGEDGADADGAAATGDAVDGEGDSAADAAAAGADGEKGDADKGTPADDKLPAWLKDRVKRATEKDRENANEAQALRAREQELADREALIAAREKAAALTKPDPDAFDDVDDYETAKAEYDAAQAAAREATKKKPTTETKTPSASAQTLPLGITGEEINAAVDTVQARIPASMHEKLGDPKIVLPATVLLHMSELPTKEATEQMGRFILGNQETIKAIAKLPARQQTAALVQAFTEKPPGQPRKVSGAADPITPVNGRGESGVNLSKVAFSDFEEIRNKEEREARRTGRAV